MLFTVISIILLLLIIGTHESDKREWYSEKMYGEDPPGGIGYREMLKRQGKKDRFWIAYILLIIFIMLFLYQVFS